MAAGHGTERVVRMVVVYEPGNRGAEEERRMIENEAFGGNSPSRKKRLALDCADSVRVSRGLGTGLTARQKGR